MLVDKSAKKIVDTVASCEWSHSTSYRQEDFHCEPLDFRQQEVARAV